ncbi:MAG TPA: patatin-like phospholipase family protein [Alphaproteobacteria bacterium]|nr:patatin-like phospholipase family protein [Alphaproteobacteria bacterium]
MKWVVAAGMLARLEQHGITADLVVGTSGGGLVSAYYASGQVRYGCTCVRYLNRKGYGRDGKSKRFINPARLIKRQPAMDIEGLVDTVFGQLVPLDWNTLRKGNIPAYMTAVGNNGVLHLLPLHGVSEAEQKMALKNTSRVPAAAHHAADEDVLWDGVLLASLPVKQAFEKGATHVLAVRCGGSDDKVHDTLQGLWRVIALLAHWQNRKMLPLLKQALKRQAGELVELQSAGPEVLVMALPHVTIGVAEDDEAKLFRHMVAGYRHAGQMLELPDAPLPPEWEPETALYL